MQRPNITTIALAGLVSAAVAAGSATAATQITGAGIKDNTVTSADLKDRGVQLRDLAPATVRALRGAQGPQGPQGAQGPQGPAGLPGAPGGLDASRVTVVQGPTIYLAPGGVDSTTVYCPFGQKVTGGGYVTIGARTTAFWSHPTPDASGWSVGIDNQDSAYVGADGNAYAVCVAP